MAKGGVRYEESVAEVLRKLCILALFPVTLALFPVIFAKAEIHIKSLDPGSQVREDKEGVRGKT
ncbi:MAG: hypothetical protein BGO28_04820 [Alphaproteobacteria bacterium 43-37]|nr:MAG: hypothetical protein BGO28_04820 [Alphaproteobacteria bacterium 43-37]